MRMTPLSITPLPQIEGTSHLIKDLCAPIVVFKAIPLKSVITNRVITRVTSLKPGLRLDQSTLLNLELDLTLPAFKLTPLSHLLLPSHSPKININNCCPDSTKTTSHHYQSLEIITNAGFIDSKPVSSLLTKTTDFICLIKPSSYR